MFQQGSPTKVVAYEIDLSTVPPRFNWKLPDTPGVTRQKGVYFLEGDSLMICLAGVHAEAATEFLTQPCDGRTLFVLNRLRPAGEVGPSADPQWMHLGTYVLSRSGQSMLLRLAVDRQGLLVGDAYDLVANTHHSLKGSVNSAVRPGDLDRRDQAADRHVDQSRQFKPGGEFRAGSGGKGRRGGVDDAVRVRPHGPCGGRGGEVG